MKKLLAVILVCVLASFLFVGCFVTPADPDSALESTIVCEGGYYSIHYNEWSFTGCEDDPWYAAGVYWHNADSVIFLIGDTVWPESVLDVYGSCPTEYVEEIFLP